MNDDVANLIIAQLLFLESDDPEKDINFYINSPGGVVTSGLAVYDTMQYVKPDIATVCIGQAASMGASFLRPARRETLCAAQCAYHDSSTHGWLSGPGFGCGNPCPRDVAGETGSQSDPFGPYRQTGRRRLKTDTDRDYFMSGEEARTYGIVDHVIAKRDDLGDGAATEKKDDE